VDIICAKCGEPWDVYTVLHDEPENFERHDSLIIACPHCNGKQPEMTNERQDFLRQVAALAELCGSDIDGFAGMLEDFGLT
jgi:5-methylcytosine-specific restriction endonuclease McrA